MLRPLALSLPLLGLLACSGGAPGNGDAGATGASDAALPLSSCQAPGGVDALCGTLTVPEDPEAPDGRSIELAVTVLPATVSTPEPDPLFALHGGPGGAARFLAPLFAGHPVRQDRAVVLVDQRGTGGSNPMRCIPEDPAAFILDVLRFSLDPAACEDFEADPRFYVTPVAMDDLDRVREALGYERINVWGGSYGARAALVYMRRHPDRVRAAVLDGVAPPTVAVPRNFARTSQAALDDLLEDCRRAVACHRDGEGPATLLEATLERLEEAPETVTVSVPGQAASVTLPFGRRELAGSILYGLYSPQTAALVPTAIRQAHAGAYETAAGLGVGFATVVRSQFGVGMMLSVLCAEDAPVFTRAEMQADAQGTFLGPDFAAGLHEACAEWPVGELPEGYHETVRSEVPTLLLSGQADPVTPPEFAAAAGAGLPASLHVVFPDMGHGQTGTPCGAALVRAFLAAGSVEGLDVRCVAGVERPPFPG